MSNFTRMLLGLTCALALAACSGNDRVGFKVLDATPAPARGAAPAARSQAPTAKPAAKAPATTAPLTKGQTQVLTPDASSYYKEGMDYYNDGKYQLAVYEFTTVIQLDPDFVLAYKYRGDAYGSLGEYKRAIEDFDRAIQLYPDAWAYDSRGVAYGLLGQEQRAIEDFDKAVQLDPDFALAYKHRGIAYANLGQYTKSDADKAKACSLDSQYCSKTPTQAEERESSYLKEVDRVVTRFYEHRRNYNNELEKIGASFRKVTDEESHRLLVTQVVSLLEKSASQFKQDWDDFTAIIPPPRFQSFHLLLTSSSNDMFSATQAFITYYSMGLNLGTLDESLGRRGSELLRKANEDAQKAAYEYAELRPDDLD